MGLLDVNRSEKIIYEVSKKLRIHNLTKVFCDITEVKGLEDKQKSIEKIYDLSSLISTTSPVRTKISLLETKEQIGERSFFEDVMTNMGFRVKVTTKPEEGLKWLGVSSEEKT
jgi:hypothetical protein